MFDPELFTATSWLTNPVTTDCSGYKLFSPAGGGIDIGPEEYRWIKSCLDSCAGVNPTAIPPLLALLRQIVTAGREHEREVGLHDQTNVLSAIEAALEKVYDTGVTSQEPSQ